MAVVQIPNLPIATSMTGAELLEIVQGGESKRTTSQSIADLAPDMTFPGYWLSAYSLTNQTNPVGSAVNKVGFDATSGGFGVFITSSSRIGVANNGVYNIQLSLQVDKTDAGVDQIDVWLMKNNSNVASTNRRMTLSAAGDKIVFSSSYTVILNANDYVEIAWSSADVDLFLYSEAAAGFYPAMPSALVNVQLVKEI